MRFKASLRLISGWRSVTSIPIRVWGFQRLSPNEWRQQIQHFLPQLPNVYMYILALFGHCTCTINWLQWIFTNEAGRTIGIGLPKGLWASSVPDRKYLINLHPLGLLHSGPIKEILPATLSMHFYIKLRTLLLQSP